MKLHQGERFGGRYDVFERLGEGAFAEVYRAKDLDSGAPVAIKVLKESALQQTDIVERFRREVFAVASVSSPHVVGLRDFGISNQDVYIVMEFVGGPTLRQVMDQAWSREDVFTLIGHVGHALAAAHAQQIVHRDLKPENVILQRVADGGGGWRAKVVDFGFAKLPELERELSLDPITNVGLCFGTPQYMSPEQVRGLPIDAASDLYALGVMAYELLARRRPWDGDAPQEIMRAIALTPAPHLGELPSGPARHEEIDRFFQRALAKSRADRPRDAQHFVEELGQALFGEEGPLQPGTRALAASARVITLSGYQGFEDITSPIQAYPADVTPFDPKEPSAPLSTTGPKPKLSSLVLPVVIDQTSDPPLAVGPPRPAKEPGRLHRADEHTDQIKHAAATPATPPRTPGRLGQVLRIAFWFVLVAAGAFLLGRISTGQAIFGPR